MRSRQLITGLLALIFGWSSNAHALDPTKIAKKLRSSSVEVFSLSSDGEIALGTGFYIGPSHIVTNEHVVRNQTTLLLRNIGDESWDTEAEVLVTDPSVDLALLRSKSKAVDYISHFSGLLPPIGERIYTLGNPNGLAGTFSDGVVSNYSNGEYIGIQITAPVSSGSSGGPLVDSSGALVGVVRATLKAGQNLNFAIPTKFISRLLLKNSYNFEDIGFGTEQVAQILGDCDLWKQDVPADFTGVANSKTGEIRKNLASSGLFRTLDDQSTRFFVADGPRLLIYGAKALDHSVFMDVEPSRIRGLIQNHAVSLWVKAGAGDGAYQGLTPKTDSGFPWVSARARLGKEDLFIVFRYLLPCCFYWSIESVPTGASHISDRTPYYTDLNFISRLQTDAPRTPGGTGRNGGVFLVLSLGGSILSLLIAHILWRKGLIRATEIGARLAKYNLLIVAFFSTFGVAFWLREIAKSWGFEDWSIAA